MHDFIAISFSMSFDNKFALTQTYVASELIIFFFKNEVKNILFGVWFAKYTCSLFIYTIVIF